MEVKDVKSGERPAVQWFVECNPFSNESVQRALAEQGIGDAESKYVGMLGSDGKEHDVILIPSNFVTKLREAKQGDKRFKLRFFKRNGSEGVIYSADFVEKRSPTKKLREAEERLKEVQSKRKK